MAREYSAFRQKQIQTEVKGLHFSLRRLNTRIYKGKTLDLDRERLESQLLALKECEWFDWSADQEDDWICTEGTMAPSFLHLKDEKTSLFLEKLLINGNMESDDDKILKELHTFYADLYSKRVNKMSGQIIDFWYQFPLCLRLNRIPLAW